MYSGLTLSKLIHFRCLKTGDLPKLWRMMLMFVRKYGVSETLYTLERLQWLGFAQGSVQVGIGFEDMLHT